MVKTYILDTNVLLHNPGALFAFEDNEVVIPMAVIEEIDNQKKRQDEVGRNARVVSQELDKMRESGCLSTGVPLPSGGRLRIELNHQDAVGDFPPGFDPHKADNRILAVAYSLSKQLVGRVFLVSKDLNLRVKSDVLGIPAQDFYNDKVNYHELYTGAGIVDVTAEEMDAFFKEGRLEMNGRGPGRPHEFFVLKNHVVSSQSALSRYFRGELRPLVHGESTNQGIKARNKEQRFALELLLNDQIRVATLVGRAGTGKTLARHRRGPREGHGAEELFETSHHAARHPSGQRPGLPAGLQGGEAAALDAAHL